ITLSRSLAVTLLRLSSICPPLIFKILQTTFLFGETNALKFLILPAETSDNTMLPEAPSSSSKNTVVPSIFFTVHKTTSSSFHFMNKLKTNHIKNYPMKIRLLISVIAQIFSTNYISKHLSRIHQAQKCHL